MSNESHFPLMGEITRASKIPVKRSQNSRDDSKSVFFTALPCLDDGVHDITRQGNCSFIANHKTYLRLKGYDVSGIYSLNRNRSFVGTEQRPRKQSLRSKTDSDMTSLPHFKKTYKHLQTLENCSQKSNSSDKSMWRPKASTKSTEHYLDKYINALDGETHIEGHIRADAAKNKRLGKVMTKAHLRKMLTQDEMAIFPRKHQDKFDLFMSFEMGPDTYKSVLNERTGPIDSGSNCVRELTDAKDNSDLNHVKESEIAKA